MTPAAMLTHLASQRLLAEGVRLELAHLWARVEWSNLLASWAAIADEVFVLVALAQQAAAAESDSYVDATTAELGIDTAAAAAIVPASFGAVASDGRNLDDLLARPVWSAVTLAAAGLDEQVVMPAAGRQLQMIGGTQVTDAGRVATGAAIVARPGVTGWVRAAPPWCSRCAVLAGRVYRWDNEFDRHPDDNCQMVPTTSAIARDLVADPSEYFDSLTREQQDATFTVDGAQAIRDGADISRVVNARRGMAPAQVGGRDLLVTHAGVLGRDRRRVRLMPESIYDIAGGDRAEALRLLRVHQFIA